MTMNNHKPHAGDAAEYAVSPLPWVTGSLASSTTAPDRLDFPKVTKSIVIRNTDTTATNGLYVGWSLNGVMGGGITNNRFLIPGGSSEVFEVRCRNIWVLAQAGTPAYSVFAGLTTVAPSQFPLLTGSVFNVSTPLPGEGWQGVG